MTHEALLAELGAIRAAGRRLLRPPPPGSDDPGSAEARRGEAGQDADPEVTVAMPARNAAPFVAEAIASVLRQEDVRLELVVVDDGSADRTADLVAAVDDARVRLLRSDRHGGIGQAHNRIVQAARAPFVAHVDADDVILQGALRALVDALRAEPDAGQACCDHVAVDASGRIGREDFERQRAFLDGQHRDHPDTRRGLLRHGMVANALRTYRREALEEAGPFAEDLAFAVDYDMSVRIADRRPLTRVRRLFYVRRIHGGNAQAAMRFRALRSWSQRRRIVRRLLAEGGGRLLGYDRAAVERLMLGGLVDAVGLGRLKSSIHRLVRR